MQKSDLYAEFSFALKFFNRERVAYPLYFEHKSGRFAVGRIESDLGPVINDFRYTDAPVGSLFLPAYPSMTDAGDTDLSTSRAYRVLLDAEEGAESIVCVTHESGLEIFCMATVALIGTETGKFLLKRILEGSERRINAWMKRKSQQTQNPEAVDSEPFVSRVALRTPHWELTLDGRFTPAERDALIEQILLQTDRSTMENCVSNLDNNALATKALSATQRVSMRRFVATHVPD